MREPKLDYYVGRSIHRIEQHKNSYTIVFIGNKRVNVAGTKPPEIEKGMEMMAVILQEDGAEMRFCQRGHGNQILHEHSVMVDAEDYRISDKDYDGGPHQPQVTTAEEIATPPDPSPQRDKGANTRE